MPVFPFQLLQQLRPNWCPLASGRRAGGETLCSAQPTIADYHRHFIVLSGSALFVEGRDESPVSPGDIALIHAGLPFHFKEASADFSALQVNTLPAFPFRNEPVAETEFHPVGMPPIAPLPPSRHRGIGFHFDPTQTFAPSMLARQRGEDLLLCCHLGAMSSAQIRELRQHCLEWERQLAVLELLAEDDEEVSSYFDDPGMKENLAKLRPRYAAVQADPATEQGRARAALMMKNWHPVIHPEAIAPAVVMPLRPWDQSELRGLFTWLAEQSPARIGLVLRWDAEIFTATPPRRQVLEAILPWVVALEYQGKSGFTEACHFLDGLGFQGWVFRGISK